MCDCAQFEYVEVALGLSPRLPLEERRGAVLGGEPGWKADTKLKDFVEVFVI